MPSVCRRPAVARVLLLVATPACCPRLHPAADELLATKKNRALLEPYAEREAAACGYMRMVNPGITVVPGPLCDPQVGWQRTL